MSISARTTALELAALVSQTLEASGIHATLSGGAAVSIYTDNRYRSEDLDFVTTERRVALATVLKPLGFALAGDKRHFEHTATDLYLEFPSGPLEFGNRQVQHNEIPRLQTPWGPLRVITPTLCVVDRLAAWWHWNDRQSWDQAVMVARYSTIDYDELRGYAREEGADPADIEKLRQQAGDR